MNYIAYLGPEGTYTQKAAEHLQAQERLTGFRLLPLKSIDCVFDALNKHDASYGVIPLENSYLVTDF